MLRLHPFPLFTFLIFLFTAFPTAPALCIPYLYMLEVRPLPQTLVTSPLFIFLCLRSAGLQQAECQQENRSEHRRDSASALYSQIYAMLQHSSPLATGEVRVGKNGWTAAVAIGCETKCGLGRKKFQEVFTEPLWGATDGFSMTNNKPLEELQLSSFSAVNAFITVFSPKLLNIPFLSAALPPVQNKELKPIKCAFVLPIQLC